MKILIAFASRYCTTQKCANVLVDILKEQNNEVITLDLEKNLRTRVDDFDAVVLGGSFVMGRMNKFVKKFVNLNLKALLNNKIGIFMCGMDEKWQEELKKGFPESLLDRASAKGYFGYELNLEKMSGIVRGMMKNVETPNAGIRLENIEKFADEIMG